MAAKKATKAVRVRIPTLPKLPKTKARYSIAEWYGRAIQNIPAAERVAMAQREVDAEELTGVQCPFTLGVCNKKGGVCSIQAYEVTGPGPVTLRPPPVCVCPNRFAEAHTVFPWVAETILGTKEPIDLAEIGFLNRFRPDIEGEPEPGARDFIGRIDSVLIHPTRTPLDWCALEIQAVYFSGKSMMQEFKAISKSTSAELEYPAAQRRPDWRSSGPKRLLPQLQTKVPTISMWGKKMAVVIDRPFFTQLTGLDKVAHISNSQIIWFVMDYEACDRGWKMIPGEVVLTTLETSVKALTGGTPLSKVAFENQLRSKLAKGIPDHPLASL